ncbi:MAG: hypothetical protein M3Y91_16960 [Actinomycetota bacterium]|nr:hypothetical protein [Actinomycetota bacterium]
MSEPDDTMVQIGRGIELGQAGERAAAHQLFADLWTRIGPGGEPFHRCAVAHSTADVQDDPADELVWDLRALEAADLVTHERARDARGFYPSLHLNLGDVYRRLGDLELARAHLRLGQAALGALDDDGYAQMVKGGLDRLAGRLSVT